MGILRRLFGGGDKVTVAPVPPTSPSKLSVIGRQVSTPAGHPVRLRLSRRGTPWVRDDLFGDGKVDVTGYRYVYADTGMSVGTIDWHRWHREHGAVNCYAAGVTFVEADLLQSDGLQPSRRLTLVRDPENPHDANAVSLTLEDGRHVGWVPRRHAVTVAPRLDAGERLEAVVIEQQHTRDSQGRRLAYSVLIGDPAWLDELFVRTQRWTE